ncbi:MAG: UDP-N-acetylmuramoyl-L-alanine--D-glutamate ligase [Verrucomicrobia bacterium]|nr:UDP-N-acetylmuramoyl-L-alanine--D-glutamate ligase [Verrucomicrobiota bacterium]
MQALEKKQVLVVGNDQYGRAAARLLRDCGAFITEVNGESDVADTNKYAVAVVSPDVSSRSPAVQQIKAAKVRIISDLELGFQESRCLSIAVSGTSGKSSTCALISRILAQCERQTIVAGYDSTPICEVVDQTCDLDFLTISASAFQLEHIEFFRPSVAVLLNVTHDHQDRFDSHADYLRTKARLFQNQQPFDWAIVQSEAWAQMKTLGLPMPGKVITFSASNSRADIFLDRGLLISRLEDWAGPLLDMAQTAFRGPHFAENLMAALAVSRVLRLSLEQTIAAIKGSRPLPNCCEFLGERNGVTFINDADCNNLDALRSAIWSIPSERREPNVWLIAGGGEKELDYYDLGPLFSQRLKGAFLFGKSREKLRGAWSLFTPCTLSDSLLEAVSQATAGAVEGDTIIFSPACSSFDQFRNDQHRGEVFREAVKGLMSTSNGAGAGNKHKMMI